MKTITVRERCFTIEGVGADDPYFLSLTPDHEHGFHTLCEQFVAPAYVCLDIGANIGVKSLALSQFATKGRILAVDAAPGVFTVLCRNIENSGIGNIECHYAAVGGTDGTTSFAENSAYGHISPGGITVPMRTLRSLVEAHQLKSVDFIKIDVEGFEWPILRASLADINAWRSLVLFEFNSWCQLAFAETSPVDFARWILASFSQVFLVRPGRTGSDAYERISADGAFRLVHTNLIEDRCVTDILATNDPDRLRGAIR